MMNANELRKIVLADARRYARNRRKMLAALLGLSKDGRIVEAPLPIMADAAGLSRNEGRWAIEDLHKRGMIEDMMLPIAGRALIVLATPSPRNTGGPVAGTGKKRRRNAPRRQRSHRAGRRDSRLK